MLLESYFFSLALGGVVLLASIVAGGGSTDTDADADGDLDGGFDKDFELRFRIRQRY